MELPPWEGLYSLKIVNGGVGGGEGHESFVMSRGPKFYQELH